MGIYRHNCVGTVCKTLQSPSNRTGCRWRRLDVWPFMVLYAIWAVVVGNMIIIDGLERLPYIQLGTYAFVAVHVRIGHRWPAITACQYCNANQSAKSWLKGDHWSRPPL